MEMEKEKEGKKKKKRCPICNTTTTVKYHTGKMISIHSSRVVDVSRAMEEEGKRRKKNYDNNNNNNKDDETLVETHTTCTYRYVIQGHTYGSRNIYRPLVVA